VEYALVLVGEPEPVAAGVPAPAIEDAPELVAVDELAAGED
jgi:hypothetical protein